MATIIPSLNLLIQNQSHNLKWLSDSERAKLEQRLMNMSYDQYQWLKHGKDNQDDRWIPLHPDLD